MSVALGHLTDRGLKRAGNEDAYLALLPPDLPPGIDAVLAVADGMSGLYFDNARYHDAGSWNTAPALDTTPNADNTRTKADKNVISKMAGGLV